MNKLFKNRLFWSLRISHKLIISYLLIGIISVLLISFFFYQTAEKALLERTFAQLSSINNLKKNQINDYLNLRKESLHLLLKHPYFEQMFKSHYSSNNQILPIQYKQFLDNFEKEQDYKGLAIIDTNYNILHSTLDSSRWIKIKNQKEFKDFLIGSKKTFTLFDISDSTSKGLLSGAPIYDSRGQLSGIFISNKNYSNIQRILNLRTGMGNTGESYIIGSDSRMRSTSRFFPEKVPYTITVNTRSSRIVNEQNLSEIICDDYRGEEVVSVGRKIIYNGVQWIILSEIDIREAMTPILAMRNKILLLGLTIVGIILLVTLYLSQKITRPILKLRGIVLNLAKGRLPENMPVSETNDEVGQMSNAIGYLIEGLKRTSSFAYEIGKGNFDSGFKPLSDDDLLGRSLMHMRDRLKELKQKEQFLSRERSAALIEGQENERKRLARELHDSIGQMLTAIRIKVSLLGGSPAEQKEIKGLLDETIAEVRRVSNSVMPTVLIDFGLESGLKQLVNSTAKYAGFEIDYKYEKWKDRTINFETTISIYRIAQEAINNIIKYAQAQKVELKVVQKDDCIEMRILDDGIGFDVKSAKLKGTGLQNMKERVKLQGGEIDVQSMPKKGTQIIVKVPI